MRGDIRIKIGPQDQKYESYVEYVLEKIPKEESKPYVKIVIEQGSNEEAKNLEVLVKELHQNIIQFLM